MLEPEEIFAAVVAWAQPKVLAGKRVLLTAGPTFEAIDPVRGITNASSGKMGFALAQAAAEAGATVTIGRGPDDARRRPPNVERVDVQSAARDGGRGDRARRSVRHVRRASPPSPTTRRPQPSDDEDQEDGRSDDDHAQADGRHPGDGRRATGCAVLRGLRRGEPGRRAHAEEKRRRKKLPLIVANRAQDAIGGDDNEVTLLDDAGAHPLPRMDKLALARALVARDREAAGKMSDISRVRAFPRTREPSVVVVATDLSRHRRRA